ncbi:TetR/AcrR family transcriptional regulator [Paenibacillus wynnii]|uniref:TetR family transcriptional regulator n=1 Tax=Paenibacillus wynnii TaxID=268407 RepID=A0A098M651_9BACL|nr:TetR/AcrR family transcriptional regulator [Paenibacillus wynnii]KGE18045.1 TetR family transcriptional regulator [Paenibacillus wynnii]
MARNKEFNVDTVLSKAMTVFWRQGYELTSMQDLVTHMGIHKRSMYDTFGDKHNLFMKVLDRYAEIAESKMDQRIQSLPTAIEAIRLLFDMALHKEESEPLGCLIVNTATELSLHDPEAAEKVNDSFSRTEKILLEIVKHGQDQGEIPKNLDPSALSEYLNNALVGFRVMVKVTRDSSKLQRILDTTLSILERR